MAISALTATAPLVIAVTIAMVGVIATPNPVHAATYGNTDTYESGEVPGSTQWCAASPIWGSASYCVTQRYGCTDNSAETAVTSTSPAFARVCLSLPSSWHFWHHGIDIGAPSGTSLLTTRPATITIVPSAPTCTCPCNKGIYAETTAGGNVIFYLHGTMATGTSVGQQVLASGSAVAVSGNVAPCGGSSSGAHLHLEVHKSVASLSGSGLWDDLNPETWIGLAGPSALSSAYWHLRYTNSGGPDDFPAFQYGIKDDIAVAGDWCGTGQKSNGVYRPSTGYWYLHCGVGGGAATYSFQYGNATDYPVVGDWTGSGIDTIGVVRLSLTCVHSPGTPQLEWLLRNSNSGGAPDIDFCMGNPQDWPVVGHWIGQVNPNTGYFISTVGVARPNAAGGNGYLTWYFRYTNTWGNPDNTPFTFGLSTDIPVVGDWTGQCATTIGVVRPGTGSGQLTWYLGLANQYNPPVNGGWQYGNPLNAAFDGDWNESVGTCLMDTVGYGT